MCPNSYFSTEIQHNSERKVRILVWTPHTADIRIRSILGGRVDLKKHYEAVGKWTRKEESININIPSWVWSCPSWISGILWETEGTCTEFCTKKYFLESNSSSNVSIETQILDYLLTVSTGCCLLKLYAGDLASPQLYIYYPCSSCLIAFKVPESESDSTSWHRV